MLNSNAVGMKYNDSTTIISSCQFLRMKYIDFLGRTEEEKRPELFESSGVP